MVAQADSLARIRLRREDLTEEERLCLQRVQAIITYGANRDCGAEERLVQQSLQHCLMLKERHLHALRARNPLWWLAASRTKTDPSRAFRDILNDSPNMRQDACRKFNGWSEAVDHAAQAALQAPDT